MLRIGSFHRRKAEEKERDALRKLRAPAVTGDVPDVASLAPSPDLADELEAFMETAEYISPLSKVKNKATPDQLPCETTSAPSGWVVISLRREATSTPFFQTNTTLNNAHLDKAQGGAALVIIANLLKI